MDQSTDPYTDPYEDPYEDPYLGVEVAYLLLHVLLLCHDAVPRLGESTSCAVLCFYFSTVLKGFEPISRPDSVFLPKSDAESVKN